jgi:UDPglucose--hexose-1-phosphate uridylyltransferase
MLKSKWNITTSHNNENFDINEDPHRRYNPLINEWVLVSPHVRNVLGKDRMKQYFDALPEYDPTCYFVREMFKRTEW